MCSYRHVLAGPSSLVSLVYLDFLLTFNQFFNNCHVTTYLVVGEGFTCRFVPMGFRKLRKSPINFVMSFRMEQLGAHYPPFHKIWYFKIFQNLSRNFKVLYNLKRVSYTLHVYINNFVIICRLILVRNISISDKICVENQTTHFVFKIFFPGNHAVCVIVWEY